MQIKDKEMGKESEGKHQAIETQKKYRNDFRRNNAKKSAHEYKYVLKSDT